MSFRAGQIASCVDKWLKVSSVPWLISSVKGVTIRFVARPVQVKEPRPYRLASEEVDFVDEEVHRLLKKGVIENTDFEQRQVISNIFLRPKKDGAYRMNLHLTWLNDHVAYGYLTCIPSTRH